MTRVVLLTITNIQNINKYIYISGVISIYKKNIHFSLPAYAISKQSFPDPSHESNNKQYVLYGLYKTASYNNDRT